MKRVGRNRRKKTEKKPLSQVGWLGGAIGESKADIKEKGQATSRLAKIDIPDKNQDIYVYKSIPIGYDDEENQAKLNGWQFVKAAVKANG